MNGPGGYGFGPASANESGAAVTRVALDYQRQFPQAVRRMVLDGVLQAWFERGLCTRCRLWWDSLPQPA